MSTAGMPASGSVSISLVTFNAMSWLPGLIASLHAQGPEVLEVLVVDNASTDGTAEALASEAARDGRMRLSVSSVNRGYATAHNTNIERAAGELLVLLNQDVELDHDFCAQIAAAFADRPSLGAVQARVRQLGREGERLATLDTTGLVMQRDRRVISRAQGEPDGPAHGQPGPVWGVDGPVAAYRRAALSDARLPRQGGGWEVLDEDFFMYKEDVDLAWRLRLLGWQAAYAPAALAWHARSASGPSGSGWRSIIRRNRATPAWIRSLSWRNQRLMQVKNDSLGDFVRDLPWIARREILAAGYILVADPGRLTAMASLVRLLPAALRKRRHLRRRLEQRALAS
jgi:GT2 family glycosyltransferase